MQLPPGFSNPNDPRVCKLKRSIYGLKQASRQWFSKLSSSLLHFGFTKSDPSLFIRQTSNSFMVVLIYVDDVIIASNDLAKIADVKRFLCVLSYKRFGRITILSIKDLQRELFFAKESML